MAKKNLNAAGGAGGDAVITVAANNTPAAQKDRADFVCTGANDEVTIEALVAAGVTVKLMVGDYIFNDTLDIMVSNFRLEGSGPGTVISGILAVAYIEIGDESTTLENVTICDLKIDGTSQTAGEGIYAHGGAANYLTNICILNCVLVHPEDQGIMLRYVYGALVSENIVEGGQDCIDLDYGDYCRVEHNYCYDADFSGITVGHMDYSTVADNTCEGCRTGLNSHDQNIGNTIVGNACSGNEQNITLVNMTYSSVIGNTAILATTWHGIKIYNGLFTIIEGNISRDNDQQGLWLQDCDYCVINGNIVTHNSINPTLTYAEMLLEESAHNLISDNLIGVKTGSIITTYGIHLDATSDWNILAGNDLDYSGNTANLFDQGENNIVQDDNKGVDNPFQVRHLVYVKNVSGTNRVAGDVMSYSAVGAAEMAITDPTGVGEDKVWGMLVENIDIDAFGYMLVKGGTAILKSSNAVGGAINIGDFLCTENGNRAIKAAATNMAFAIALEACDSADCTIDALLIVPRKL